MNSSTVPSFLAAAADVVAARAAGLGLNAGPATVDGETAEIAFYSAQAAALIARGLSADGIVATVVTLPAKGRDARRRHVVRFTVN